MMAKYKCAFVGTYQPDCLSNSGRLSPNTPNLCPALSYVNASLIYCTIIPLPWHLLWQALPELSDTPKALRAVEINLSERHSCVIPLEVTSSKNSTHLSNTVPACSLCGPDLLSLLNANSNVPWLEDNIDTSQGNDSPPPTKPQTQGEGGTRGGGKKLENRTFLIGKGERTKTMKALFCLCRDCAVAATIKPWLTTTLALRGEIAPTRSYVTKKLQRVCWWVSVCMCLCVYVCRGYTRCIFR